MRSKVSLSVYDLSSYNSVLEGVLGGVYHVGVVFMDLEWSYAASDDPIGVFWCEPQQSRIGTFKESVAMGESDRSIEDVISELRLFSAKWQAKDYNTLSKNCLLFSQAFLNFLIPHSRLPPQLTSAPDSMQLFAGFTGNPESSQKISTHTQAVMTDRMLQAAETRMQEFLRRKDAVPEAATAKPSYVVRVLHGPSEIKEPEMEDTLKKLGDVKSKVGLRYSPYALSFIQKI